MATDFNTQAAKLVAAIPTDSQGDGRKFADAVRKSLNYIATYAGTGSGSGGGGEGTVTTISNQLSNVKMTYKKSGDYYNLIITWETGDFNEARVYSYALLNLQQSPQKGDTSVNWNQVGSRIYQSKKGELTATISNVLPGYRYRVTAIGVTDDGKRSEENKAPSAQVFIPVQVRDTTPPASLTTTATAKGLLIEWTQKSDAFYTFTELRDGNNDFGTDDGLLTRSRGQSFMYIPKERNGTIYAANFGISGQYSTSLDSNYSFPQLTTPAAPTVTVSKDANDDQYKITVDFNAPAYGLGTNVYINNVKFTVDYTQHTFVYYTTKEHDVISLTYFDCIGESNHSTSVTVDVSNPRHSDLNTFIDVHSNNITGNNADMNIINAKKLTSNTITVDTLKIDDTIEADAVKANTINADDLSANKGAILDLTANTVNAIDATLGNADISTLTYMTMTPTDGADGMITANRIISNGTISTTGEVDANKIVFTVNNSTTEDPSIGKETWQNSGKEDYGLVLRGKTTYFNGVGKGNKAWINNETGAASFGGGVSIDGDLNVTGTVYGAGGLGAPYQMGAAYKVAPQSPFGGTTGAETTGEAGLYNNAYPFIRTHSKTFSGGGYGDSNSHTDIYGSYFQPMFTPGEYSLSDIITKLLNNAVTIKTGKINTWQNCNCNCSDCNCGDGNC